MELEGLIFRACSDMNWITPCVISGEDHLPSEPQDPLYLVDRKPKIRCVSKLLISLTPYQPQNLLTGRANQIWKGS